MRCLGEKGCNYEPSVTPRKGVYTYTPQMKKIATFIYNLKSCVTKEEFLKVWITAFRTSLWSCFKITTKTGKKCDFKHMSKVCNTKPNLANNSCCAHTAWRNYFICSLLPYIKKWHHLQSWMAIFCASHICWRRMSIFTHVPVFYTLSSISHE